MALSPRRLIRLGQASKELIRNWQEGVSLAQDSGQSIEALYRAAAATRWSLAFEFRRHATASLNRRPPLFRSAISRYYYSMYHALRAASYVHVPGDDHESHSDLPRNIPTDFPDRDHWSNQLKSAREFRNQADYDPYPTGIGAWRTLAIGLRPEVDKLLPLTRAYLVGKGCEL